MKRQFNTMTQVTEMAPAGQRMWGAYVMVTSAASQAVVKILHCNLAFVPGQTAANASPITCLAHFARLCPISILMPSCKHTHSHVDDVRSGAGL